MNDRVLEYILRLKDEASKEAERAARIIDGALKNAEKGSKMFAGSLAVVGTTLGVNAVAGLKYAGEMERLTTAMKTVTGSMEEAEKAMAIIRQTAKESPFFETATLAQFVQLMAAAGQNIDDAVGAGLAFGDVMAAFGKGNAELSRMGNTLSQVMGKGKADIVDFKELVNAGWVSVRKDVAETMKVSMAQFEEMVSAGEIGYDQIRAASEKYYGAAEEQSNGLFAVWQRLIETFDAIRGQLVIDLNIFDGVKNGLNAIIAFIDENEAVIVQFLHDTIQWANDNIPILTGAILGGLVPALYAILPPLISSMAHLLPFIAAGAALGVIINMLIERLGGWEAFQNKVTEAINQLYQVYKTYVEPALLELWGIIKGKLIPEYKKLWEQISPILIPALKLLAIVLGVTVVAALRLVIEFLAFTIDKIATAIKWFNDFVSLIKRIPDMIRNPLETARNLLDKLNPFHRESPSLVDNVLAGVKLIRKEYESLAQLQLPSLTSQLSPSLAYSGNQLGTNTYSTQAPITIYNTMNNQLDVYEMAHVLGFELEMRSAG